MVISINPSRLRQLFLPKKLEIPHTNQNLKSQPNVKINLAEDLRVVSQSPRAKVWEHIPGTNIVRRGSPGGDGSQRPENLSANERESDVHARECLQEYHSEAGSLDRVEHPEPEPERASNESASFRTAGPREVHTDVRDAPEHLAPTRGAKADGEDGENPGVLFREDGEESEHAGPDADEEEHHQQCDLPLRDVRAAPEVGPIPTIGCG